MLTLPKLFADGVLGDYIELRGQSATFGSFTWSFRLPPGLWWWQWAQLPLFATDATAANRMFFLCLAAEPSSAAIKAHVMDDAYQAASSTRTHWWIAGGATAVNYGITGNVDHRMPSALIVPREYIAGIGIIGTAAGDASGGNPRAGFWRIGTG